jgi:hypothetical protein
MLRGRRRNREHVDRLGAPAQRAADGCSTSVCCCLTRAGSQLLIPCSCSVPMAARSGRPAPSSSRPGFQTAPRPLASLCRCSWAPGLTGKRDFRDAEAYSQGTTIHRVLEICSSGGTCVLHQSAVPQVPLPALAVCRRPAPRARFVRNHADLVAVAELVFDGSLLSGHYS